MMELDLWGKCQIYPKIVTIFPQFAAALPLKSQLYGAKRPPE